MCGIVMVVNSNPNSGKGNKKPAPGQLKQNSLFYDMMLASQVRGTDGTGLIQVDKELNVWTDKTAKPASIALDQDGFSSIVKDTSDSSITIGHVRAATAGSIIDENCHPFQAFREDGSYIIGVHNGTLHGWDTPATEHKVDSAWAFDLIAKEGVKAFDEFYGAFTFIWYDSNEPGKVFIARNDERPLHLMRNISGTSIYAASEAGMLQWLVDKHSISVEDGVYSLDTYSIVCIDTTKQVLTVEKVEEFSDAYSLYSYSRSTYTPAASCPVPSAKSSGTPSAKTLMVEAIKDCLRRARWSTVLGAGDEGPVEMGSTGEEEVAPYLLAEADWYDMGAADAAEVARANAEGVLGVMVHFDAVEYDGLLGNIVGEVVSPGNLKSPIAYMKEENSKKAAGMVDTLVHAVIVGARNFDGETEYIVAPVNEKGLRELAV